MFQGNQNIKSRCQVRSCAKNANVSLHKLPHAKFAERRQQWIKALQLPTNIRGKFYVCSDHFLKNDFRQTTKQNWLCEWAVPSVNLPKKRKVFKSLENLEPELLHDEKASVHNESSVCEKSIVDEGFCSEQPFSTSFTDEIGFNSTATSPNNGEKSDELVIEIDSDVEDDFVTHKEYGNLYSTHSSYVPKRDCSTQTYSTKQYADKCIQTNLA